jgi:hypothetical protein
VDPRACLGDVEKRKLLTLPRLELDHSVVHPIVSLYTDCALPARCSERNDRISKHSRRVNFKKQQINNFAEMLPRPKSGFLTVVFVKCVSYKVGHLVVLLTIAFQ